MMPFQSRAFPGHAAVSVVLSLLMLAACGGGDSGGGNGDDNTSALTASITVAGGESTIYAFDPLAFTGGATGGTGSYSYNWNFDATGTGGGPANSTAQNPTVVFQNTGTYTVQLTVTSGSATDTATHTITVLPENDPDRVWYTIGSGSQVVATEDSRTITATFDPRNSSSTPGGRLDRTTVSLAASATQAGFSIALAAPGSQLPYGYTAYSSSAGPIFSATYQTDTTAPVYYVLHSACSGSDSKQVNLKRYGRRIAGTFSLKLYRYDGDGSITGTPNNCVSGDNITITGGFNALRTEVSTGTGTNMVALCSATTGDSTDDFCHVDDNNDTAAEFVTEDADDTVSVTYNTTRSQSTLNITRSDGATLEVTFSGNTPGTYTFAGRTASAQYTDAVGEIYLTNDGASSGSKCGMGRVDIVGYGGEGGMVTGSYVLELFHYNMTTHVVECSNRKVFYGSFEATREADQS